MAGVRNSSGVTYKSSGTAMNDLIGGQVQLTFGTAGTVMPHVKTGRLKAIGVTSAEPSALAPGIPTVAASLPNYVSGTMTGVFAPAGTPRTVIQLVNREIVQVLKRPEIREKFMNSAVEPVGTTPEEFAAKIKSEMARMGKMIKDAGIRLENAGE